MSKYDRYLRYFRSKLPRPSFKLIGGGGSVMVSAPHAVEQLRDGRRKYAEPYTGVLARFLHDSTGCPVIFKTKNIKDDANHDEHSPYRDAIAQYVRENAIAYLIDLHQMSAERALGIDLGTGHGENIKADPQLLEETVNAFKAWGFEDITVEKHFPAVYPNTVSAATARDCGIACIQIEFNTKLLSNLYRGCRFSDALAALEDLIKALNLRANNGDHHGKDLL
jgi:hypothetical protein